MPRRDRASPAAPLAALAIVGERWTLLVMREVLLGRRRFADIRRNTGIAANILSDRLTTLVEQGLLEKDAATSEYRPTPKGVDVNPVLVALMSWGDRYAAPAAGPPRVVVHTACGHDAHPQLHCRHCGEAIPAAEMKVRPGPGADARQREEPLLPAAQPVPAQPSPPTRTTSTPAAASTSSPSSTA